MKEKMKWLVAGTAVIACTVAASIGFKGNKFTAVKGGNEVTFTFDSTHNQMVTTNYGLDANYDAVSDKGTTIPVRFFCSWQCSATDTNESGSLFTSIDCEFAVKNDIGASASLFLPCRGITKVSVEYAETPSGDTKFNFCNAEYSNAYGPESNVVLSGKRVSYDVSKFISDNVEEDKPVCFAQIFFAVNDKGETFEGSARYVTNISSISLTYDVSACERIPYIDNPYDEE